MERVNIGKKPEEMIGVLGHSLGGCIGADLVMNLRKDGQSDFQPWEYGK